MTAELSSDAEEESIISYEDLSEEEKTILNDLVEKCKNGYFFFLCYQSVSRVLNVGDKVA